MIWRRGTRLGEQRWIDFDRNATPAGCKKRMGPKSGQPSEQCRGRDAEECDASAASGKKPRREQSAQLWYYRDEEGTEQGPYESSTMRAWYLEGYFQPHVLVAPSFGGEVPKAYTPIASSFQEPVELHAFQNTAGDACEATAEPAESDDEPGWRTRGGLSLMDVVLGKGVRATVGHTVTVRCAAVRLPQPSSGACRLSLVFFWPSARHGRVCRRSARNGYIVKVLGQARERHVVRRRLDMLPRTPPLLKGMTRCPGRAGELKLPETSQRNAERPKRPYSTRWAVGTTVSMPASRGWSFVSDLCAC